MTVLDQASSRVLRKDRSTIGVLRVRGALLSVRTVPEGSSVEVIYGQLILQHINDIDTWVAVHPQARLLGLLECLCRASPTRCHLYGPVLGLIGYKAALIQIASFDMLAHYQY